MEKTIFLSVIIATLNRSEAVADISLPSLLTQDTSDFEILIWDASGDDITKKIVSSYTRDFSLRGIELRYFQAPRKGLTSQRNDAVRKARGDIVFFIDDDSEVSPSGISAITAAFNQYRKLKGAGLPLATVSPAQRPDNKNSPRLLLSAAKKALWREKSGLRKIKNSTRNLLLGADTPGIAEWLSGGAMAFHKSVFDELKFDERLERFGGYALGEDADFSHRVLLRFREALLILPGGTVTHHAIPGGRLSGAKINAAFFYNSRIIRGNFNHYVKRHGLFTFLWEQRILRMLKMFEAGSSIREIIDGYRAYRQAVREDSLRG